MAKVTKTTYKRTYSNGDIYEGPLSNERPTTEGKYTFANGDVYAGEYNENEIPSGKGRIWFKNGDMYVGSWKDGKRFGKHDYHWANGDVCYGGTYHSDGTSSGTVTRTDGTTYYCRWDKNGKSVI